jgi:menaquinone-specific isochorismate synthase
VTSATPAEQAAPLVVRTARLDLDPEVSLLDLLPAALGGADPEPVTWLRRGEGLVGWGVAAQLHTHGAGRFEEADRWWRETAARAVVRDEVGEPGSGLVAFGSFGFSDHAGHGQDS